MMHAALFNGIASHVYDYGDTHLDTIIHPTGPVASALPATTESLDRPVTGEEFITALWAGVEAKCKVGLAVWPKQRPRMDLKESSVSTTMERLVCYSGKLRQPSTRMRLLLIRGS